jgi:ubiquinone/menaquinone biosynthesis C-methylase UbiE
MSYNPEAIRRLYGNIAAREDEFEKEHTLRNEIPREFIKRYLRPGDVVLDAGGGAGVNAIMMAQRCQRVTLLDITPKLLALSAANIEDAGMTERIDLIQGDITDLGRFGDDTFSFVVCLGGSLSYVQEKGSQAVRELVRVAQSGSVLIIGCDSKYGFVRLHVSEGRLDEAARMVETGEYEVGEGAHAHLYTVVELTRMVEQAGCEIVEVVSTPTLTVSFGPNVYAGDEEKWRKLKELELRVCAEPELIGAGHHLFCVARKV